jgi:DNA mismatch repair protein MSH4
MRPRHSAYRDKSEPSSFRLFDLDLESDSESDHDDGSRFDPGLPHASKPQVGDGFNAVTSTESTQDDRVVCAISESRSSDVVGLAVINITTGRVEITRILNDDRYQRVIETLWRMASLPQTFLVLKKVVSEQSKSLLAQCLKTEFPDAEIVPLDRQHWNESEGLRMIDRFAWRTDVKATRSNLEHNFYASCAFSAVRFTRSLYSV